jgi:hypothetical protein
MKVAVILTGHLRCWHEVFPNFKQRILDRFSPDVWITSWHDEGYWLVEEDARGVLHQGSPKIIVEDVNAAYKPIKLIIEDLNQFLPYFEQRVKPFTTYYHRPRNTVSMYYKVGTGMQMLERHVMMTGTKYDLVIRMRPDMILHQDLPDLDPTHFYTIHHPNHMGEGTGDMFQAGSYEAVSAFCKIGTKLEDIYAQIGRFCPHMISEHWIKQLGVSWKVIQIAKTIQHSPVGSYQQAPGHEFKDGYIAPGGVLVR